MPIARPRIFKIALTETEFTALAEIACARSLLAGLVQHALVILLSAEGLASRDIAATVDLSGAMVGRRRRGCRALRSAGLYDAPRSGRPRTHDDDETAGLVRTVLRTKPARATQRSVRSAAAKTGIHRSTVQRNFVFFGVQPHRTKAFKLSTDPFFVEKVRDIVGLSLNPPDKPLVLSVDGKSQIQALERTAPILPMGLDHLEGVTHDYLRHDTTTLFVALEVQSGRVIARCKPHHRH